MRETDRTSLIQELEELCGIPESLLTRLNNQEIEKLHNERVAERTPPAN
ncbi:hypothetical protein SAMN05192534_101345 [Alteribacillus persepolensis]|uniref:Fur-regulated basic protein A n=1 Tax=Alteribacillus persepolensis TaxID=568899 RepID=A0A1G7Z007_9BACI|nr:hypothetical protein [Alteribacillus persepolensis]SDH02118.1 hypothetical protein SAMN05192534_101345 [Alteribacillus persepolensis]